MASGSGGDDGGNDSTRPGKPAGAGRPARRPIAGEVPGDRAAHLVAGAAAEDRAAHLVAGAAAEDRAAGWLVARGLRVIARNVRFRGGEIDLICRDGEMLVFVEVRLRRSRAFGGAAASITAAKRARLILAARLYLATHATLARLPARFDCVLFEGGDEPEWIRDAFDAG